MFRKLFIGLVICLLGVSTIGGVLATDISDDGHTEHLEKRMWGDFGEGDNFIPTKPSDYLIDVDPSHYDDGGFLEKTIC